MNTIRSMRKKVKGNFDGEGRILGGLFVIGAGKQGILLCHLEKEFGDHANLEDVLQAARQVRIFSSYLMTSQFISIQLNFYQIFRTV